MTHNTSLAELIIEKLFKRRDLFKGVTIGFGILWMAVVALAVYFLITKHTYKLFIPLAILPVTMLPSIIQWSMLSKELKKREQ